MTSFILFPLLLCHHICKVFLFVGSKELSAACWPVMQCPCSLGDDGAWWDGVPAYQLSWSSVLKVVLTDPLGRQLCQDVVQVVGIGVTVACQVGTEFCLVVNLVPDHRV